MGCYIWYSEESSGRGCSPLRPLLAVPNVTTHPCSVLITVLLYSGPLLRDFYVLVRTLSRWNVKCCAFCLDVLAQFGENMRSTVVQSHSKSSKLLLIESQLRYIILISKYKQVKFEIIHLTLRYSKEVVIATQLNSTSNWVELSWVGEVSIATQLNSTRRRVVDAFTAWTTVTSVCRSWRHKQKHDWLGCTLFNWVSWVELSIATQLNSTRRWVASAKCL